VNLVFYLSKWMTTIPSICCTPEPPDYSLLTPEEKQRFGYLVNQLRKEGHDLTKAQRLAYYQVLNESIPY